MSEDRDADPVEVDAVLVDVLARYGEVLLRLGREEPSGDTPEQNSGVSDLRVRYAPTVDDLYRPDGPD